MPDTTPKTFKKNERLKSRKSILRLMSRGRRIEASPLLAKYTFNPQEADAANKIMVLAPKKLFKKAVDRNLLKRRIREAYRLNKQILPPCRAHISFTYTAKEKIPFSQIQDAVVSILKTIAENTPSQDNIKEQSTDGSFENVPETGVGATTLNTVKCIVKEQGSGSENECSNKKSCGFLRAVKAVLSFPFVVLIKFYQICISPLKPATCRFTPTCSQYAIEAFRKYGPFKGFYLATRRILRCHPWGGHGYDPVP